jgi:hypothetical protein
MELIDPETQILFGNNVLVKFETIAPKLNKEFFDEFEQNNLSLESVEFAMKELEKFNAQFPLDYIDLARRRVGFVDYAQCTGVVVAMGDEAFTKPMMVNGTVQHIKKPNAPVVGDKIIISKEAGQTFRDKDNNLYRFISDIDIQSKC